ncbi:MAG: acyltransferase [Cyclobacteriaceae bacterium]|nr:acyltransferase [Cyclobacteriaceae bacterium]
MKSNNIAYIDFAKSFAIVSIVLYHICLNLPMLPMWFKQISWFGGTGIHLFFFISGFGISMSKWAGFKNFLNRRFLKIYLPYFIFIMILIPVNTIWVIYPQEGRNVYLSHILLYKMFVPEYINSLGGHFWFLSTIFQFYLCYPLLRIFKLHVSDHLFLLASFLISIGYMLIVSYYGFNSRVATSCFLLYLWEFSLGIYLAEKFKATGYKFWDLKLWFVVLIAITGIGLMAAVSIQTSYSLLGHMLNDFPAFIGYFAISILAYRLLKNKISLLYQFFVANGKFGYSLYLVHILVLDIFILILSRLHHELDLFSAMLVLPFMYLASVLFYQLSQKAIQALQK